MKFGHVSVDTRRLADLSYSLPLTLDYGFSSSFAWKKRCDVRAESCGALSDATVLPVLAISANRNVLRGQSRGGIEYAERMWQPPVLRLLLKRALGFAKSLTSKTQIMRST
jgi:hypothetical protein